MSCLFCRIVNREIPGSIVYEDDRVLAFNDINPQAPTHVLVVSEAARRDPQRSDARRRWARWGTGAARGSDCARARAFSGGYRTVFNTNRDAGQTVFHIHLHCWVEGA
jgi:histidine triad (HIT) family protein